MSTAERRNLRVAQWSTGNIGTRALRELIRHPALDVVGVLVHDPAKAGVDAGTLCGEKATGIVATTDPTEIVALAPDCVVYMPQTVDVDDVVALLDAGGNIVTTAGALSDAGGRLGDDDRARVLAACERGGTSVYHTGSSPGFITDALPFALLSLQRHVESYEIEEYANLSRRDSPTLLFELMGFGRPLESYSPNRASYLLGEFGPALGGIAAAFDRPVDEWTCSGEVAAAARTTTILAGELAKGTVAAQRNVLMGISGGAEVVRFTATWYCTTELEPQWDVRPTGWRVQVRGDAPFDVELPFPVAVDDLAAYTPAYTANRPVNAIPYVCAARPGFLATDDLPPITPAGPRDR
jgi:4-hydroxy-tetrahydrodipicolinate reductase